MVLGTLLMAKDKEMARYLSLLMKHQKVIISKGERNILREIEIVVPSKFVFQKRLFWAPKIGNSAIHFEGLVNPK